MQKIEMNHDCTQLYESFMLSKEQSNRIDSVIWFESIVADNIIDRDYEGNPRKAPRVLRTKTGILSRCTKYAQDEQELAYMMFIFMGKHEMINKMLGIYSGITRALTDISQLDDVVDRAHDEFKDKMSRDEVKDKLHEMLSKTSRPLKPLKKLIRQVENSNYDFSLFKAMIDEEDNPDAYLVEVIEESAETLNNMKKSGMFGISKDEDDED